MAQRVGGVLIDVQTNIARIQKDFAQINNNIKRFAYKAKKELKAVGIQLGLAFSVYKIKRFITEGVKLIDTMQDMAQSSGISTRKMQGWVQAASYAGVEATGVAKAVKRLNTNILDAHYGLGESKRLFHDLGIEYDTSTGKMRDTGPVLDDISDKFAKMDNRSRKASLANKILGRSGSNMIPVMNMTAAGIEKVTKNLEDWGALVTDETFAIMDQVNKNFEDMGAGLRGIKLQVLSGMAEELQQLSTAWVNNQEAISDFVKAGDLAGKTMIYLAVGAAGVAASFQLLATVLAAVVAFKPEDFADPEVLGLIAKKLEGIVYNWGFLMKDLLKPLKFDFEAKDLGQGLVGINKLLEDQKGLISKAVKEYKGKAVLLAEEHNQLLRIYVILSKETSLSEEHEGVLKAIGKRMEKIRLEHERLKTLGVWDNMKYGFTDYADSVMDRNKQIQDAVVNSMKTMEDSIVDGLRKGRLEWASFTEAVLADITRIIVRQQITGPFATWLGAAAPGLTPAKVPIGSGGNVIPAPIPTTPTARGRRSARGRVADTTVNLSNDVQNIVAENTYLMNRDVDEFVKNSESQFRRLGRTLKRSLNADEMGRGGVLGYPTGYSDPSGGPGVIPIGGGSTGGITTSGIATSGGIDMSGGSEIEAIMAAIKDPTGTNIAEAIKETNIIKIASEFAADAMEHIFDGAFGEGASDDLIDKLSAGVKNLSWDDANVVKLGVEWGADIGESILDSLFGEDTTDNLIDDITNGIKDISWENTHIVSATTGLIGGVVDGIVDVIEDIGKSITDIFGSVTAHSNPWKDMVVDAQSAAHEGADLPEPGSMADFLWNVPSGYSGQTAYDKWDIANPEGAEHIRRGRGTGEDGGGDTIINVPITIEGDNALLASELRTEIEKTVIEVLRRYA